MEQAHYERLSLVGDLFHPDLRSAASAVVSICPVKRHAVRRAACSGRSDECDGLGSVVQLQISGRSGFTGWRHRRNSASSLILGMGDYREELNVRHQQMSYKMYKLTLLNVVLWHFTFKILWAELSLPNLFWLTCVPLEYSEECVPHGRVQILPPH